MAVYKIGIEVHQLDEYWVEWDGEHPPSDEEIHNLIANGGAIRQNDGVEVYQDTVVSVGLDS